MKVNIYVCNTLKGVKVGRTIDLRARIYDLRGHLKMYRWTDHQVEGRVLKVLKDLDIYPVHGREYFDHKHLDLICNIVKWETFCSEITHFSTSWDLTYIPRKHYEAINI